MTKTKQGYWARHWAEFKELVRNAPRDFQSNFQEARNKQWDEMSEKAIAKARKRGNSMAALKVVGQTNMEAMLSRGWTLEQSHGLPTPYDINHTYQMTKRVLGH